MLPLLGILIAFGLPLAISLVVWILRERTRRRFVALAARLKARPDDWGLRMSTPFGILTVELDPGSDTSRRNLEVRLGASEDRLPVLLRRETTTDRLGKHLAINHEPQIGDADFDRHVYIESDISQGLLRTLLGADRTKRAVRDLLAEGFDEISIHSGPALVTVRAFDREARVPEEHSLRTVITALQCIAASAATHRWPQLREGVRRVPMWQLMVLVALLCACVLERAVVRRAQESFQPLGTSIYVVAVLLAFIVFAIAAGLFFDKIRGRSDSFRWLLTSTLLLGAALPGWSVAALLTCNAWLDRAPPQERRIRIAGQGTTTGEDAHHYVELLDLRDEALELELSEPLPSRLRRGDLVVVQTGNGALGWEWIRGVAVPREATVPDALEAKTSSAPSSRSTGAPARPPRDASGRGRTPQSSTVRPGGG